MVGRPSDYSQETVDRICERIADGESLRSICVDEDMPDKATVFRWLAAHDSFRDQYSRARETQAETIFDEMLDIADDGSNDWMERKNSDGENIGWQENGEAIRRSQLRIAARQWMLGKMAPKKYGDKVTNILEGGDRPIKTEDVTDIDRAKAMALLASKAARAK
jgi:hypothetical protein